MFLMISALIRLMIFVVVGTAQLMYWMLRAILMLITATAVAISSAHSSRRRAQLSRHRQL